MPLARGMRSYELLEKAPRRIASFDAHTFTALNTAFINDGAVVHVAQEPASPARFICCS